MPEVSVDNTPVTVALDDAESFTPAAGVTIVGRVQVSIGAKADITEGKTDALSIVSGRASDTTSEISVVLTDQTTVTESGGGHAYISGFVV